ncbi:MAG: hypothetical protein AAFY46_14435, partial [Planctomycetota bacterium]
QYPQLTADQVELFLKEGADDLGDPDVDDVYGYGRASVYGSLNINTSVWITFPDGRPETIDPDGTDQFSMLVVPFDDTPIDDTGVLHVLEDGEFVEYPMVFEGGGLYSASFPSTACLGETSYYVSVQSSSGETIAKPVSAPNSVFTVRSVAETVTAFSDDMEIDLGWTVEDSPDLSDGSWERGFVTDLVPTWPTIAKGPPEDYDGSGKAWVTGIPTEDDRTGDTDVDTGSTTLFSPAIDLSSYSGLDGRMILNFGVFFLNSTNIGNGFSQGDGSLLIEISDNGLDWQTLEMMTRSTVIDQFGQFVDWQPREYLLDGVIERTDAVQVRFTVTDDQPYHPQVGDALNDVVEAAIDAVAVRFESCIDLTNTTCPADTNGDGEVTPADFNAWVLAFNAQTPRC